MSRLEALAVGKAVLCKTIISASAVAHCGTDIFAQPHLAEVAPKICFVAFYDSGSEWSGIFYYPLPAGGSTQRHSPF